MSIRFLSFFLYESARLKEFSEIISTHQSYGLTLAHLRRYKSWTPIACFGCLGSTDSPADIPTLREWRNWQTRET